MPQTGSEDLTGSSGGIVVLAPRGRDAQVIEQVLQRTGIGVERCADLRAVRQSLDRDVSALVMTEEALGGGDLEPVLSWCEGQAAWSGLPVIILATKQAGPRPKLAADLLERLGNVVLLERPVNAETLASAARSALRARSRQYQTRGLILERERREQVLRDLSATLERRVEERTVEHDRVWRNSRDLLVVIDAEGILRAVNPAWTAILGQEAAEITGRSFYDLVWAEDAEQARTALHTALLQGEPVNFETRFRHVDGRPRWISWRISVEGRLVFAYGRDVSTEKEQAEALRKAADQLRQAQKMEAVGQLTGGLAHDFNNLLTGIGGSLEILERRLAQRRFEELDRYINAAQGAVKRAAALTHRLLAFSRRQTLDPTPTDVNRLVSGLEELLRRSVGPSVEVEIVGPEDLWTALVDQNQLENALLNLCINARDAMPDGGRITIQTANLAVEEHDVLHPELTPGHYLALCVEDTGCGMSPDVIERAFDPFFTTKPIGQGTGLGLSMIYGFVRQSGGQIRIQSEAGRGTTITLYLPRHLGRSETPSEQGEAARAPRAEQGETVLIVDDEPTLRMLVKEVLEELGYIAVEAADGASGLAILQSARHVDLLVTDVGLPGAVNGRQVADAGRSTRPDLKVLFITGYAEQSVFGDGKLEPWMHILTKPFAMQALATKIKELLGPP